MSERAALGRADGVPARLVGPVTGGFVGFVIGVFAGLGLGGVVSLVGTVSTTFGSANGWIFLLVFPAACAGVAGAAVGAGARPRVMLSAVGAVAAAGTLYGATMDGGGPRTVMPVLLVVVAVASMAYAAGGRTRREGR